MKKQNFLMVFIIFCVVGILLWGVLYYSLSLGPYLEKKEQQQKLWQEYYDNKLVAFENENALQTVFDVAFVGDSLTDGYDVKNYYPQYNVTNRGIGGDTTFTLETRLQVSVFDAKAKVVVLLIGGNNIYTMFQNYENILVSLKNNMPTSKIVLVSLTSMGQSWGEKNEIAISNNKIIKSLANKYDFNFVDMFSPLYDDSTKEIKAEYTTDGAHLTNLGYQVFTDTLTPVLEELLE